MSNISELFKKANDPFNVVNDKDNFGMVPVPEMKKTGFFFPGGYGTYHEPYSTEGKNIMVLGQDWDTKKVYEELPKDGNINIEQKKFKDPTSNNLLELMKKCGIEYDQCFFTNAFMGLRKEGKNTGKSPAWKDKNFVLKCQEFFLTQLHTSEDFKLVLVMGKEVAHFIAGIPDENFPEKFKAWKQIGKIDDLYEPNSDGHIVECVYKDKPIIFQFITHTSLHKSNLAQRWGKEKGYLREINYIKEAIGKANL